VAVEVREVRTQRSSVVAESRGQGPRRGDKPRGGSGGDGGRSGGPRRGDAPRSQGGRPQRDDRRGPQRDDRRGPRRDERDDRRIRPRDEAERTADQAKYDGPPLDPEITGKELDRNVAQQLRGLPEKLAARVARHLVAAGMLLEEDPKTAYQHTLAARARAARIAVVREACGEAAYHAGEYAEALAELRAAKRMNGNTEYLPVMADCERALGRPEKALALARNPSVANLEDPLKAEMTIVEAGARRDLGELDAALRTLENAPLRSRSRADWVARLRYAYADTLLAAGRREDAVIWFHRTVGVDGNQVTDALERLEELESSGS
jgi:tetratricopeptide (TPR) repeat protein